MLIDLGYFPDLKEYTLTPIIVRVKFNRCMYQEIIEMLTRPLSSSQYCQSIARHER